MRALALALSLPLLFACGSDDSGGASAPSGGGSGGAGSGGTGGSSQGGTSGTGASSGVGGAGATGGGSASGVWSMGYYTTWEANDYPVAEIEWSGLTHIALAFYMPDASGNVSLFGGDPNLANDIVSAAHAHGKKAIASIGGADSGPDFQAATTAATLDTFVQSLVALMDQQGFDGIDIDWEPLTAADQPVAANLANAIRQAHPAAILTIPVGYINTNLGEDLSGYAQIATAYDQINIMTYGMSGAWDGWKSWHSSPIYATDSATPVSVDSSIQAYVSAGVPKAKLGFGIGFYGLCYTAPVTEPGQALGGSTIAGSDGAMSYANIMESYFEAGARKWDAEARAPYLSFPNPKGPNACTYISYDDAQSISEKAAYLKTEGLGGVIQWEINEGFIGSAPVGQKNPLLTAIGEELLK